MSPVRSVTYVSGPDPEKLVDEKGFEPSANRTAHLSFTAQSVEKCFFCQRKRAVRFDSFPPRRTRRKSRSDRDNADASRDEDTVAQYVRKDQEEEPI